MSCCSGPTQTRELDVLVQFRPYFDRQLQLKFNCKGRDGNWRGHGRAQMYFGDPTPFPACTGEPYLGQQEVHIKGEFHCVGQVDNNGDTRYTLQGTLTITVGHQNHRGSIDPVELNCFGNGPGCEAVWENLYLRGLGQSTITVKGLKRAAAPGADALI
jgi:hypothetical protein